MLARPFLSAHVLGNLFLTVCLIGTGFLRMYLPLLAHGALLS